MNKDKKIIFTVANCITMAGIILASVVYWLVLKKLILAATLVYGAAAVTDLLDGKAARAIRDYYEAKGIFGKGESEFGAKLDPIRDFLLKMIIFPLSYYCGINLIFPCFIVILVFCGFIFFNRRINKAAGKTIIIPYSKILMVIEAIVLAIWFIYLSARSLHFSNIDITFLGKVALVLLVCTNIFRMYSYGCCYAWFKEKLKTNKTGCL